MTKLDTRNCTYIGVFLTFACQYHCPYCINRSGEFKHRYLMSVREWERGLSRIQTREDLPLTLQGGEPTLYRGFYDLVGLLGGSKYMDILTNFDVNMSEWCGRINPAWLTRPSKYPNIRVSYHPGQSPVLGTLQRVIEASRNGYSIGIWAVDHPAYRTKIRLLQRAAKLLGVDFRLKEFMGWWGGAYYGEYKYPKGVSQQFTSKVECKSNELLIAPDGYIHRCHADLYAGRNAIGHILDTELPTLGEWRACDKFGRCNECDVKMKTDRFQRTGYASVEIRSTT